MRALDRVHGAYFKEEQLYRELHSKNFKKYYRGKPTKRYLRLMEQIKKAERIEPGEFEMLLMS
ncbi:MAG: hypothetical protein U5L96_13370 [Owenweeksia sp.]|nr:hypothetical protein [Owenweeksia sp.]